MSRTSALFVFTCDRCGTAKRNEANVGPTLNLPDGWHLLTIDQTEELHLCAACFDAGRALLTRDLVPIGWARQSGSGKSWTELPSTLERDGHRDRWFDVYALGNTVKRRREA